MTNKSCKSCSYLLATMLFLTALFSIAHSGKILIDGKYMMRDAVADCNSDLRVSAICYHCGEQNPIAFQEVHAKCCNNEGDYRKYCTEWYTEEPKRGRRSWV